MDKQQARQIIRETFEDKFDKDRFINFIKNLLNHIDESPFTYQGNYIPENYQPYINKYTRVGKYHNDKKRIDILIITLRKETSLERARTKQRDFVAGYLQGKYGSSNEKDAALVAYVSPDQADWRFSLVKMGYKFEKTKSEKTKVKEELTPARRWSFLVGENERNHTAQERLVKILANDEHDPPLKEIENAFDIEPVTREFFRNYRKLFLNTKEEIDKVVKNNPKVKADFENKGVDTVNFAKKLLGQIVFLYFLQKKGWLGVGRDDNWGAGSKQFLRELFKGEYIDDYQYFFNDVLEPLFYEALRIDRSHDDDYYSRFDCKIPFLNGGLFDPIGNYDWVHTDINLPDELFSNTNKTKECDIGDGILDVFDRYNFTVREDEPLEKEVAIDPELLGKAYEKFNAIRPDNFDEFTKALKSGNKGEENKFNKNFGVYYTPPEIVHYMCRQSLINYLFTELNSGTTSYEKLGDSNLNILGNEAKKGQLDITIAHKNPEISNEDIEILIHFGERVSANEARVEYEGRETKTYSYQLPESIRNNAELIDQKLEAITICDPAVGSGAFPVGMMNEIVRVRNVLSVFLNDEKRNDYEFKRRCIEHSLYGVDIDPGAVEIAKLRLWLSLVVDETDIKNIKPLPNLDYKIVCGNSLLSVEKDLFNFSLFNTLEKLKPLFFKETDPTQKQEYKKQIDDLISQITNGHTEFDFALYFSEVFHNKGGFDVVIANPPYIQLQKDGGRLANMFKNSGYKTFEHTGDIYALFYEKGLNILKSMGHLCFISSNKWMRAGYGKSLRKFFNSYNPLLLIDLGPNVFESATVDTNILIIQKSDHQGQLSGVTLDAKIRDANLSDFINRDKKRLPKMGEGAWFIGNQAERDLKEKIERIGKPLKEWDVNIYRGVVTGFNKAFIIDTATRDRLVAEDPKSAEILKPILRGRDIKRYGYEWAGLWIIFIPWHFPLHNDSSIQCASQKAENELQKQYPAIYKYLLQFKGDLSKRNKDEIGIRYEWYALQRCAATYYPEFEKKKAVWAGVGNKRFDMGLVPEKMFLGAPANFMTGNRLKYLLGIIHSSIVQYFYDKIKTEIGSGTRFYVRDFIEIPIPPITPANQSIVKQIENLVDKILSAKKQDTKADTGESEREIDQLVYQLYDLTQEEIKIVEGEKE